MTSRQLRLRFLAALSGGVLLATLPLACSGNSVGDGNTNEDLKPSCSSGSPTVVCFAPGSTHFNTGNAPAPQPVPTPTFDANNCQVQEEVSDGCCLPALTGPELVNGECCYGFCTGACCGRPLWVEGELRVAPVATRHDWTDAVEVDLSGLTVAEREQLSREWLRDAQLEHASVASFARFVLELVAFGAPADLVERAQRAMGDEIAHARACFALASAYAGAPLGPDRLELTGVLPASSLAEAAGAAVREGCINETVAALAASRQLEQARDPAVRQVLERIARDEAEHAELAWRFVHWALATGDAAVATAVQAALRGVPASRPHVEASPLGAHGRLSPSELDAVAHSAWREVIAPCAGALS